MSVVDIVTIVIGGITVGLLFTLLVMMRTMYVLVRRDTINTDASESSDSSPNPVEP